MKDFLHSLTVMGLFFLLSCAHKGTGGPSKSNQDHLIGGTVWFQTSAEYKALSYQAYNTAKDQLNLKLKTAKKGKLLAVVLDSDETILDNGAYQATNILENRTFSNDNWKNWVDKAEASAIPGALDFLQFAASKNVEIFIVTNRKDIELEATYKNFQKLKYPIKKENILIKGKSSGKEDRRVLVSQKYEIALLIGDNASDFSSLFDKKSVADRAAASDALKEEFGRRMIVLPNPMYGDWESALYNYDFSGSDEQRSQIRKGALKAIK